MTRANRPPIALVLLLPGARVRPLVPIDERLQKLAAFLVGWRWQSERVAADRYHERRRIPPLPHPGADRGDDGSQYAARGRERDQHRLPGNRVTRLAAVWSGHRHRSDLVDIEFK